MFKEGVQQMQQGELDEHLGYEKKSPEGGNSGNSLNVLMQFMRRIFKRFP